MSAETWANDAGVARYIHEIWVNDNGTARRIAEIWVNDNGVARLLFQDGEVSLPDGTITATSGSTSNFNLRADGTRDPFDSESGTQHWIEPQGGMDKYEVRATQVSQSGVGTFSGALNVYQSLASDRQWSVNNSAGQICQWVLTISIRRAVDATVVDTATVTIISRD